MRIKTGIYLGALPTLLLLSAVLLLLAVTHQQMQVVEAEDAAIEQIVRAAFDLAKLRSEFFLPRNERVRHEWELRSQSLQDALARFRPADPVAERVLKQLAADHDQAGTLFQQLLQPSRLDETARQEFEHRVAGQLAVVAQRRLDAALDLAQQTQSRLRTLYVRSQVFMAFASLLATALAVVNALMVQRRVLSPILRLRAATRRVARGEFGHRIENPPRDELGDLMRAFDEMTISLGAVTASRDELNREVQERQQAEDVLRERSEELVRSNAELEQFAYVASHDLQEPLRKIQAFGNLLVTGYRDPLDEQGRDYLNRMQRAAARMQALINDLLTLSRVIRKGEPFRPVDLGHIVQSVLGDLEPRLAQCGGAVDVGPLPTLDADASQMGQLFQNLLSNALKYHRPDSPPRVTMRAEPVPAGSAGTENGSGNWRIEVRDNGIGFDPKYAEQIFHPFQRLHGRSEYEGTGIGLTICRRIVERHRGTIVADARPGEGARFIVTLPSHQPNGDRSRS